MKENVLEKSGNEVSAAVSTVAGDLEREERDELREAAWRKWAPHYAQIVDEGNDRHEDYEHAVISLQGFSKGFNLGYNAGASTVETRIADELAQLIYDRTDSPSRFDPSAGEKVERYMRDLRQSVAKAKAELSGEGK